MERLSSGKYVEIANDISEKQQYDILNSGVAEVEFHKVWRRVYPSKIFNHIFLVTLTVILIRNLPLDLRDGYIKIKLKMIK